MFKECLQQRELPNGFLYGNIITQNLTFGTEKRLLPPAKASGFLPLSIFMNYGEIKFYDIADGPGVRVTLFVSGCRHHCKGCFQPQTWAFDYGQLFTADTLQEILDGLKPDYIQGLTLLGGEPFEPENQAVLVRVLKKVREVYPNKDIWCYTGYTYDRDLMPGGSVYTEYTDDMLSCIDMIVDGEFVEELKDITLLFRGSSNQRLIPLHGYEMPV